MRGDIRNKGMNRRFRRLHRSDRFNERAPIGHIGDKRRMGMMAELALRAAVVVGIRRIHTGCGDLDAQAAAIRRRQGRLDRKQQQQQDDKEAPEIHGEQL